MKFSPKPGNLCGIARGEEVLANCTETEIGDRGYVSPTLGDSLAKKGIGLIGKHPKTWLQTPGKKEDS
ncbi:MAG: hypothetical protein LBF42_03160 [Puniceicoccales bacterium]|nr:hypothetical protein [Puniceicoccales bacterium]